MTSPASPVHDHDNVLDQHGFAPMGSSGRQRQINDHLAACEPAFAGTAYGGGTHIFVINDEDQFIATYAASLDGPLGADGRVVLTRIGDGLIEEADR